MIQEKATGENTCYRCSLCNAAASVKNGIVLKTCDHPKAPVVAYISATVSGKGNTNRDEVK